MPTSTFTKETALSTLTEAVKRAQKMGALNFRDCSLLQKALQYFDPEVEQKPDFNGVPNPELHAVRLMLEAVEKAQAHGGPSSFSIAEAAMIWDLTEFWIKEFSNKPSESTSGSSSKPAESSSSSTDVAEPPKLKSKKASGKGKAKVVVDSDDESDSESEKKTSDITPLIDPRVARK